MPRPWLRRGNPHVQAVCTFSFLCVSYLEALAQQYRSSGTLFIHVEHELLGKAWQLAFRLHPSNHLPLVHCGLLGYSPSFPNAAKPCRVWDTSRGGCGYDRSPGYYLVHPSTLASITPLQWTAYVSRALRCTNAAHVLRRDAETVRRRSRGFDRGGGTT